MIITGFQLNVFDVGVLWILLYADDHSTYSTECQNKHRCTGMILGLYLFVIPLMGLSSDGCHVWKLLYLCVMFGMVYIYIYRYVGVNSGGASCAGPGGQSVKSSGCRQCT